MNQAASSSEWHILGAGSIGCLWACHLQQHGLTPRLILRNQLRQQQFKDGILFSGQSEPSVVQIPTELTGHTSPIDRLLVTTKSYDCFNAIQQVAHRLHSDSTVVLLQNGMGQQQQAADFLTSTALYVGTTTEGAFREPPNQLIHAGCGETWFGPFNDSAKTQGAEAITDLLRLQLTSAYDSNIVDRLWQKLAINAAINGLTAQYQCRNGELANNPDYRAQMQQLCNEVEQLAQQLNQPLFAHPLIGQALEVARATADNYSSMLQDVRHQRLTEIDFINGFICHQAQLQGLELPYNRVLVDTIHKLSPIH